MAKAPVFKTDHFAGQIAALIGHEANIRIDKYAQDLEKRLVRANKGFYEKMATIVGQTSMPPLGRFQEAWEPLTEPYADRRLAQYHVPRNVFFQRRSRLGSQLRALERHVNRLLGQPTVKLVLGSRKLKPGYTVAGPNARVARGPNKKFASLKNAILEDIPSKIVITAFPMLDGSVFASDTRSGLAERAVVGNATFNDPPGPLSERFRPDGKGHYTPRRKKAIKNRQGPLYAKLGVKTGGHVKRPFTRLLLTWWMSNVIRRLTESK